jgi:hypothetical protein
MYCNRNISAGAYKVSARSTLFRVSLWKQTLCLISYLLRLYIFEFKLQYIALVHIGLAPQFQIQIWTWQRVASTTYMLGNIVL